MKIETTNSQSFTASLIPDKHGMVRLGVKNGREVFASFDAIQQVGLQNVLRRFGMVNRHPVRTDLSGNTVMVEADTIDDATRCYLTSIS